MNVMNMKTTEIKPYERNAKLHDDIQIKNIAESIKQFGFAQPIVVDKDNVIIIGHGRLQAAKRLKMQEVPVVKMEDLTQDQVDKPRLLDNKLNESDWDIELLLEDIPQLDFSDFDVDWNLPDFSQEEEGYYGDERERTNNAYNMGYQGEIDFTSDFWQMPIIHKCNTVPSDLIGFNYAKTSENKKTGIHCYVDDYQFERLWNDPEAYIDVLKQYECFLSPDFSLYMDMTMPTKIWNIYRSRFIGAFYQSRGITVIPTVSWAEPETFDFCFKGLEKGGVVSVSTIGVKENKDALEVWRSGMAKMIETLKPRTILVYGGKLDYDYGDINVIYFSNHVTDEWGEKDET